jgi:hypothetical protein
MTHDWRSIARTYLQFGFQVDAEDAGVRVRPWMLPGRHQAFDSPSLRSEHIRLPSIVPWEEQVLAELLSGTSECLLRAWFEACCSIEPLSLLLAGHLSIPDEQILPRCRSTAVGRLRSYGVATAHREWS